MKKMLMAAALLSAFLAWGCEAVFTQAPLTFLQRDPSALPPAQKLAFGADALASGDAAAISSAYDSIADYISANTLSGSEAVEFNSLAVDLMAADTGLGPLFDTVMPGLMTGTMPDMGDILTDIKDMNVSLTDSQTMDSYMTAVNANSGTPEPMQSLLAASVVMAPLISAYTDASGNLDVGGSSDFSSATLTGDEAAAFTAAETYINDAITGLGSSSEEADMLYSLTDFLGMGINPN